jgi:hypothetical protein
MYWKTGFGGRKVRFRNVADWEELRFCAGTAWEVRFCACCSIEVVFWGTVVVEVVFIEVGVALRFCGTVVVELEAFESCDADWKDRWRVGVGWKELRFWGGWGSEVWFCGVVVVEVEVFGFCAGTAWEVRFWGIADLAGSMLLRGDWLVMLMLKRPIPAVGRKPTLMKVNTDPDVKFICTLL